MNDMSLKENLCMTFLTYLLGGHDRLGPHLDVDPNLLCGVPVKLTGVKRGRLLLHVKHPV